VSLFSGLHASTFSVHLLEYVLPSVPHTGRYSLVQAVGHTHLGFPFSTIHLVSGYEHSVMSHGSTSKKRREKLRVTLEVIGRFLC